MLKALNEEGVRRLTRACLAAWKLEKTPKDWQSNVIIPIYKKGDRKECTNYRGISPTHTVVFQERSMPIALEKCREIVESILEDGQCGFCLGYSTTNQIFRLEKAYDRVA